MIERLLHPTLLARLAQFPAVALMGPRQVGKTTLATEIATHFSSIYLDLELPSDLVKLNDIDLGRRQEVKHGQFLLLGSASLDLIQQAGESLAGRIAYDDACPPPRQPGQCSRTCAQPCG